MNETSRIKVDDKILFFVFNLQRPVYFSKIICFYSRIRNYILTLNIIHSYPVRESIIISRTCRIVVDLMWRLIFWNINLACENA